MGFIYLKVGGVLTVAAGAVEGFGTVKSRMDDFVLLFPLCNQLDDDCVVWMIGKWIGCQMQLFFGGR